MFASEIHTDRISVFSKVGADWHRKRTLGETYQALMNSWYGGQSTNAAARKYFEFAAITKEQCQSWILSCEYKMDIFIRRKSICLTGNVPDVYARISGGYSSGRGWDPGVFCLSPLVLCIIYMV